MLTLLLVWIAMAVGAVAMGVVLLLTLWIYHQDAGSPEMHEVARYIRNGAKTFLKRQYRTILLFIAVLCVPIFAFFPVLGGGL